MIKFWRELDFFFKTKRTQKVLLDPSFQIYTIKMAFFTELHAENIIYFDIHMKFLSKSELFLFLENCR